MKKYLLHSWRPLGVCLSAALFCSINPQRADAQPAPTNPRPVPINPQPAQITDPYVDQLKDARVERRRDAYEKLADFDDRLHVSVLTLLAELKKNPDRRVGGAFAMTLRVVSAMNIRDALNIVGDIIDFQLDPATMPHGGYGAAIEYYPVAQTVIDLKDGQKTIDLVMDRFDLEANDNTVRVHTYVLKEVLGDKIARFVLQNNLERVTKQLVTMPSVPLLENRKANVEGALKLLDGGEPILKRPQAA